MGATYLLDGRLMPLIGDNEDFEIEANGFWYGGSIKNVVDRHVYYYGMWEGQVLHFLRDISMAKADSVFLDIGANTGQHSVFMAKYAKTVHAIEPYPPVLNTLNTLVTRNNADNVIVHAVGYSNEEGTLPFFAPPDENLGTGSFDPNFSSYNRKIGDLPLVIGDEHLASIGAKRIDLIKVDIEGYERYALQGLRETLVANRPVVVMEINPTDGGFNSSAQLDTTFPSDYEYYYLRQGVCPINSMSFDYFGYRYTYGPIVRGDYRLEPFDFVFGRQSNVVAIPLDKVEQLIH
jgi:FkbM family methyltransferase